MKGDFSNASEDFKRPNSDLFPDCSGEGSKLERHPVRSALAKDQAEKGAAGFVLVRVVSVRKRLCDPDNLSVKWTLDSLRFARIIRGDEPDKIALEVAQRKVKPGEEEHTLVEIFEIPEPN